MEEVEKLFVQNFTKEDKRKAMVVLMPGQKQACHTVTYFVDMFSECACLRLNISEPEISPRVIL